MERNCKNCGSLVYERKAYCSDCGAKWIEKRITLRNVGADFADMYIGVDTKFVRTFIDMFTKPQDVIKGFINGRRMGYVDALRYLFISLFASGVTMFIMESIELDFTQIMDVESLYKNLGYSEERIAAEMAMQSKIQEVQSRYLNFIIFASIPVMALIGKLTFWGKRFFNFTEQVVFYMYSYAHIVIATSIITIPLLLLAPEYLLYWTTSSYIFMPLYIAYCYKKCFNLNWQEAILKMFIALLVLAVFMIVLTILIVILGFVGALIYKKFIDPSWDPSAFAPQS